MTDDDTTQATDATASLPAAVAKAAPALTKREARDVTAAVLLGSVGWAGRLGGRAGGGRRG